MNSWIHNGTAYNLNALIKIPYIYSMHIQQIDNSNEKECFSLAFKFHVSPDATKEIVLPRLKLNYVYTVHNKIKISIIKDSDNSLSIYCEEI
jgi:hypothetical protein